MNLTSWFGLHVAIFRRERHCPRRRGRSLQKTAAVVTESRSLPNYFANRCCVAQVSHVGHMCRCFNLKQSCDQIVLGMDDSQRFL